MSFNWNTKGIVLTAPLTKDVDDVAALIEKHLAPRGFNLIVLQVRYRYQFKNHPEVWGYDPLSYADVKKLLNVCKKNNIKLIPKMNLIGHQSGFPNEPTDGILHGHNTCESDIRDGLLRSYPEFGEQPNDKEIYYARSICLSSKPARTVVFELIDELMDVFEADGIHIGCDEAFCVGKCPICSKSTPYELIANWVNAINDHVKNRGGEIFMWGDRLLSSAETGYDEWEASTNGTEGAMKLISHDVTICDWHYNLYEKYPSIDLLCNEGFRVLVAPWRDKNSAVAFLNYAAKVDNGKIEGVLQTTWCSSGELARKLLYGENGKWLHTNQIADTINFLYN